MTITSKHIHPAGHEVFIVKAAQRKNFNVDQSIREQFELLFGHDRISVLRYASTDIVEVAVMIEDEE